MDNAGPMVLLVFWYYWFTGITCITDISSIIYMADFIYLYGWLFSKDWDY